MALDQVKTQVLILHSEQSTLDNLSAGIDDRYTVHCATSGTEALNTLGETPIHVIISAQDLPGMSGVEALREAKKRSPETIGILLAGQNDAGVEALVGEKEVFQVVRGGVSGPELVSLIDNATRQVRLLALAESANDTAANPDDLSAEHIVMETSDNGSTIISDGTSSLPALDPSRISSQVPGSQNVDVLVLTKDEEFLATVRESSRGMHNVRYANTLAQAEDALAQHNVGVAVVDAAMVGDKVEKLTLHLRRRKQRLVSIVAGRRDDGEMLMDLINRGKVYRFLMKPVSPGRARLAIEASVKHHLEGPDSAFKVAAAAAQDTAKPAPAKPAPAKPAAAKPAAAKPAPAKAAPKPVAKPAPVEAPQAAALEPAKVAEVVESAPPADDADESPMFATTADALAAGPASSEPDSSSDVAVDALSPASLSLDGQEPESPFANPKILGAAAAIVLALGAGAFFMFSGSDDAPPPANDIVETTAESTGTVSEGEFPGVEPQTPPVVETAVSAADLLDEARLARDAGQIYFPIGGNALELYASAVAAQPDNTVAASELADVVEQALSMAETAMLERRVDDAAAIVERVTAAVPDHARLPFMTAQLAQMQLRDYLDSARAAIRDNRFEDAANVLASAEALNVADRTEINAVAADLAAARSAQRVDDTLALANARMEEGNLTTPANDNARYYYELALSNDSNSTAARQGLAVIASRLVLQARAEIDAGRFDQADALLGEAAALAPSSAELAAATTALGNARAEIAAQQQQRAAAEQRAAEQEAQRLADLQRAEDERRAAAAAAAAQADTEQADEDERPPVLAASTPLETPDIEPATPGPATPGTADSSPVAISSLTRTRYVAPKYPRAAERRNLSGWVDVVFTVAMDGSTKDIEVMESNPGDVFVSAATRAVERWEFEPVVENDRLVEKRAGVRMMFAIED